MGVSSVLSMGLGALNASQVAISTTGNNISNVNTTGYSRQIASFNERTGLDTNGGQLGQGVIVAEVYRSFDKFIEGTLVQTTGTYARYNTAYSVLYSVQSLFNESTADGIGTLMTNMFSSWNDLAQEPNSSATREALLAASQTFTSSLQNADAYLESVQRQLDDLIRQDVDTINSLLEEIALLNNEINAHTIAGVNNANALMDQRDQKVRDLSELIDIKIHDNGAGDYTITTTGGNILVQENIPFSLMVQSGVTVNNLTASSPYKSSSGSGTVGYSGTDTYEYTIEVVNGGAVDGGAQFRVSLDGGKTWLTNDDGTIRLFDANSEDESVQAGDLKIWFDAGESLSAGDKFTISPKTDVYWVSPTSGPINISTQIYANGSENGLRITGGSLAGYLSVRDYMIGEYRDQLDAVAKTAIWEVNRLHSQGSGLSRMNYAMGTYSVDRTDVPLGGDTSGLSWADYLTAGNVSFAVYDAVTGESLVPYPGMEVFSSVNFDPETDSLDDVVSAINNASFTDKDGNTINPFSAQVVDGCLEITTTGDYTFSITSDTTGLAAALGINTFFTGDSAGNIGIRAEVLNNTDYINAGRINGAGETNDGGNITASEIAALVSRKLSIGTSKTKNSTLTLSNYYAALVTRVGSDTAGTNTKGLSQSSLLTALQEQRESVSGVNLDEELSNLIKFQASYKAAAKLITTADEMLQTIIGLKQ